MAEEAVAEVEAQARKMGWKPESEWKGPPPKHGFVSAEEFVETGKTVLPVVSAENKRLKEQIEAQNQRISTLEEGNARFKQFTDKALDRAKRDRENALAELEAQRADAIDNSDGKRAVQIEREIRSLESEEIPPEEVKPPENDPAVDRWIADNKWYNEDKELQAITDGMSMQLRRERPDLDGVAHLTALEERVKEAMPHKFDNPRRTEPGLESSQRLAPTAGQKTFANLPADAKREFELFKESMPEFTEEQYLEHYEWDES